MNVKRTLKSLLRPVWKPPLDGLLALRGWLMSVTGLGVRSGGFRIAAARGRGLGLYAIRDHAAGDPVIALSGQRVTRRGEYTIQVGPDAHLYPDAPLRYANHSCDPNMGIREGAGGQLRFHALQPICHDQELTWDYSTSEDDLSGDSGAAAFACHCGTARCRGHVTGWRHLPDEVRARYRDWAMPYLRGAPSGARLS